MGRKIALIVAIVIALVVCGFSLLPETDKATTTGLRLYPLELGNGDVVFVNPHRIAHWTAFAAMTVAFAAVGRSRLTRMAGAALAFALAYGTERAQTAIYHSAFEAEDVRDDAAGILVALIVVEIAVFLWGRKRALASYSSLRR